MSCNNQLDKAKTGSLPASSTLSERSKQFWKSHPQWCTSACNRKFVQTRIDCTHKGTLSLQRKEGSRSSENYLAHIGKSEEVPIFKQENTVEKTIREHPTRYRSKAVSNPSEQVQDATSRTFETSYKPEEHQTISSNSTRLSSPVIHISSQHSSDSESPDWRLLRSPDLFHVKDGKRLSQNAWCIAQIHEKLCGTGKQKGTPENLISPPTSPPPLLSSRQEVSTQTSNTRTKGKGWLSSTGRVRELIAYRTRLSKRLKTDTTCRRNTNQNHSDSRLRMLLYSRTVNQIGVNFRTTDGT